MINATGVFSDGIRKMDEPDAKTIVAASQGSHVVLPKAFLPGNSAIMVPMALRCTGVKALAPPGPKPHRADSRLYHFTPT